MWESRLASREWFGPGGLAPRRVKIFKPRNFQQLLTWTRLSEYLIEYLICITT